MKRAEISPLTMKIVLVFFAGLAGLIAYVRFIEATTIFLPNKHLSFTPKQIGIPFEEIFFRTKDRLRLNGWLVKSVSAKRPAATLLFLHGNAGNMGDRLDKIKLFRQLGLNVFIVDYRGYGLSEGRPTEQGMYLDALAAFDYLKTRRDIDINKICVYGESLGGVAATYLAAHRPVAGLIADATFSSAADMGRHIMPVIPSFLISVKMDSLQRVKAMAVPKLFIHSTEDETVPYALGKKLYQAAAAPKQFLKITGGHNDGHLAPQTTYVNGIKNFLTTHQLI